MHYVNVATKKLRFVFWLVRTGQITAILDAFHLKIWSQNIGYGLRRNLTIPFAAPDSAVPITVRPATPADVARITATNIPGQSNDDIHERKERRAYYDQGFRDCWVAVTEDDEPCYIQFRIYPEQNKLRRQTLGQVYPDLQPHQVLVEAAFTPETWRGKRIMPRALSLIVEHTASDTIREAITFVKHDNIPSLKGCIRSGFTPYCNRIDTWRLFRHTVTFPLLPEGTLIPGVTVPAQPESPV